MHTSYTHTRGMTLVEVIVAVGLLALVFGALFAAFQQVMTIVSSSKMQTGALALSNDRLEYIRSLAYDQVGTVSGIPSGTIPQTRTLTLNGVSYTERVLIEYVDDPKDGYGGADSNAILADYKLVKIEYSWIEKGQNKVISLISNVVPRGIETTAGGGTLVVNVFNANVQPLAGASVRLYNNTGTTTVDVTKSTNSAGTAIFSGAPANGGYQITVTKTGYSTDKTYSATTSNPNPSKLHVAVVLNQVSTMSFQIDALSNLNIETKDMPILGSVTDSFSDVSQIASSSNTVVAGGDVVLSGSSPSYSASGMIRSTPITPSSVVSWGTLFTEGSVPANTSLAVQVYDATASSTNPTIIPDSALPGNSAGFGVGNVTLTSLDATVYQSLVLKAVLGSNTGVNTPLLHEWTVRYTASQASIPNVPITLVSSKVIGTTPSVPKYTNAVTTNGSGKITISNLEWDGYAVTVTDASYDVAEACADIPYVLNPGVTKTLVLTLTSATAHSLRVSVVNASGAVVPNAVVVLSRPGFSNTQNSSPCGGVFFAGLATQTDYTLDISAFGYTTVSITPLSIAGKSYQQVILN